VWLTIGGVVCICVGASSALWPARSVIR
jgi:hypothetical protein